MKSICAPFSVYSPLPLKGLQGDDASWSIPATLRDVSGFSLARFSSEAFSPVKVGTVPKPFPAAVPPLLGHWFSRFFFVSYEKMALRDPTFSDTDFSAGATTLDLVLPRGIFPFEENVKIIRGVTRAGPSFHTWVSSLSGLLPWFLIDGDTRLFGGEGSE